MQLVGKLIQCYKECNLVLSLLIFPFDLALSLVDFYHTNTFIKVQIT